ncbi:DUF1573 domain-containing protein [Fulvivirgaceae bacterium BMA10]|uniref:DUF1573 domain-containing protein n=1 Tax=Splendidivirga corallicola TaxID=3051826 RepID=A0ABT8KJ09_9BACT|nr:DUF1573 domain-containing protein [Fulvivirgaceae bacterium BMA10]
MKRIISQIAGLAMVMAVMMACSNAQTEERLAALEERVAKLEGNSSTASNNKPEISSLAANVSTEEVEGPVPVFKFEKEEFDFGTVKAGEIVNHTFKFTNVGEAPLIIQSATASCGCTVPQKPDKPIGVGETGEIVVQFDSKNKSGAQSPTVTVTANTNPKVTRLKLKGTVTAAAKLPDGPVRK